MIGATQKSFEIAYKQGNGCTARRTYRFANLPRLQYLLLDADATHLLQWPTGHRQPHNIEGRPQASQAYKPNRDCYRLACSGPSRTELLDNHDAPILHHRHDRSNITGDFFYTFVSESYG